MLAVPPARPEHRLSPDGSHCEGWNAGSAFLGKRVAPGRYRGAVVQRLLARQREADIRIPSEADVAALAVDGDSLDPALRAGFGDGQVQRSAVSGQARFRDGFDCSGC